MAGAKPGVHVVQLRPISVPETLIKGNKFIKWDDSSTIGVPVTLKVDPKGYILYWKDQNKDMDFIDISLIRDTRTGKYAKVPKEGKLRDSCTIGPPEVPLEDKTLTIAFNKEPLKANMVDVDFINFVCASMDAAKEWCDELLRYAYNLISLNGSALTYLEKAYIRLIHVLDVNGRISVKNIIKMVATQKEDRRRVEKALEAVGLNAGKNDTIDPAKFTFEDFFNFYRHLVGRTEVDKVFDEIGAKKKPYLTVDQFRQFLNKEQRDPRLNEILYPYYTIKQAQEFINNYETKNGMAAKGHLSQEGFLKFLMSEENNLIPLDQLDQSHDMTAPLAHYFINSSHNTYLTGHQFNSKSSVELYRQVLLSGCRCIELDCWNGSNADEEPIITHGYTMCTDVPFKDVIEAIAESAFKTSKYPVILSFENHCSVKQQAKMASYCRSIFGDLLLIDPLSAYPLEAEVPLPSPNLLQEKIIIKNKKKHFDKKPSEKPPVRQTSSISGLPSELTREDSENGLSSPTTTTTPITPMTMGATPKLRPEGEGEDNSKMINLTNVAEEDSSDSEYEEELPEAFDNENKKKFKDDKGTAGSEAEAGLEMSALVNYVQPVHFHSFEVSERRSKSYEISSFVETQATNLLKEHPVEFVNYNKRQLSRIYPKGTRVDSSNFLPQIFWNAGCQLVALNFQTLDLAMQLNLGIFEYNNRSGYILKPDFMRRTDRKFDPFAESPVDGIVAGTVSVKVISGSLLSDKRIGTYVEVDMYGLPTDTVRKKFKTHLVPNNGINPVYDEPPFEFKKIVLPNLAVIRLSVYDENNKMLGHRVLNVEGLRPGYRHIPLRNANNLPLLLPTLFVHISVKDYVPDDMEMITSALENPIAYQTELERHEKQLRILEDTEQESFKGTPAGAEPKSPERVPNARNGSFKATPLSESKKVSSHPDIKKGDSNDDEFSQEKSNKLQRLWRSMSTRTFKKRRPVVRNSQSKLVGLPSTTGSIESNGTSVVSRTKLNDPVHLSPSTLKDLMSKKPYVKAAAKRDKELDALKKKHEKARENLKEVHELQEERLLISQVKSKTAMEKAHAKSIKKALKSGTAEEVDQTNTTEYQRLIREHDEKMKAKHKDLRGQQASELAEMCKTQFLAELNLQLKYHEPLYSLLEELLDVDHRNHLKRLKETYDAEIEDINKSMETQRKSEVRSLSKMYKDKEELSRRKREAQNRHIQLVVEQRKKLENVYERKQLEVTKILASAKEEFEKEKKAVPQRLQDAYEEKCRKLSEHLDGALRHSKENVADSGESNTKL